MKTIQVKVFPNGSKYEGEIVDNKANGTGKLTIVEVNKTGKFVDNFPLNFFMSKKHLLLF